MDFGEKQKVLDRIITAHSLISYRGHLYKIYDPRVADRQMGAHIYESAYDIFFNKGIATEQETQQLLEDKDLWGPLKEKQLATLEKLRTELRATLPNYEFQSKTKQKTMEQIDSLTAKINKLNSTQNSLNTMTIEHYANIERYKYYLNTLTHILDGPTFRPCWPTKEEFRAAPDTTVHYFISKVYFDQTINEALIRELARSEPWRTYWIGAIKVGNLFSEPATNWTDFQKALVTWSLIYDSAFESMEPPGSETIENDTLFDAWLENRSKNRGKTTNTDNLGIKSGAQEVGIVVESEEDARKVYEMNQGTAKQIFDKREKVLKEKGTVNMVAMPDVKQDITMQLTHMQKGKHGT